MSTHTKTITAVVAATLLATVAAFAATPAKAPQQQHRPDLQPPLLTPNRAQMRVAERDEVEDIRRCAYRLAERQTRDATYMPPRTRVEQAVATCTMLSYEIDRELQRWVVRP